MKDMKQIIGQRRCRMQICLKKCSYEEAVKVYIPKMKQAYIGMFEEDKVGSGNRIKDMPDGFYYFANDLMDSVYMRVYKQDGIYERIYY